MESIWSRLSWPQVVALGLVIAGIVAVLVAVPSEKLSELPWEQLVGLATVLVGGGIGALSGPLVRPRTAPASIPPAEARTRPTEPPPPSRRREEGSTRAEPMVWILLWALGAAIALARIVGPALALLVAVTLTGCGGGLLATHARAATIALVSIEGAQRALAAGHQAELAACPDPACVADVDSRWIPAGVALDAALPVVSAWIGTLEIAELAGTPDAELASVLELAMARAQEVWRQARDALDVVGLELPALGGGS
jgi:hypothetical protein